MTQQETIERGCAGRSTARRVDDILVVVATIAAGLAWLAWRAGGVAMTVRSGETTLHVGLVSTLVTAVVVSATGLALLRWLEQRDAHALRTWTVVALAVWACSLVGPLGARDVASASALVSLHLVVGSVVVVGARRSRSGGVA